VGVGEGIGEGVGVSIGTAREVGVGAGVNKAEDVGVLAALDVPVGEDEGVKAELDVSVDFSGENTGSADASVRAMRTSPAIPASRSRLGISGERRDMSSPSNRVRDNPRRVYRSLVTAKSEETTGCARRRSGVQSWNAILWPAPTN
jgi:hypothetical protein